ncbi:MAG: hypothetical protein J6A46_02225 [Clostridia bacterium]|nr:hypothetical protein [Clostridia bacterium]
MKNEFNNVAPEFFTPKREYWPPKLNETVEEQIKTRERKEYAPQNEIESFSLKKSDAKAKKEKWKKDTAFLTKIVSVCAATVIVTTSGVIPLEDVDVEFLSVEATATSVLYEIDVKEEEDLILELTNDFTKRRVDLVSGINGGAIENLVPNMRYTLDVYTENGVRVESYQVRTLKEALPYIEIVDLKMATAEDSTITFTVNVLRTDEAWGENFQYAVYFSNEEESERDFNENYTPSTTFSAYALPRLTPNGYGRIKVCAIVFDEELKEIVQETVLYNEVLQVCDDDWIEMMKDYNSSSST